MKLRKILMIVLVTILVLTLGACGGKVNPDDPNQGLWKATTGEMFGISVDIEEMFAKGFTIELQDKGKCAIFADGKKSNGSWTLDGSAFTVKGGGMNCKGTLTNGVIILEDVLGMGLNLIFEKVGGYDGATTDTVSDSSDVEEPEAATLSEGLAWWDGAWYGWLNVLEGKGTFSGMEDEDDDCYAFVDMNSDGSGTLYLWDDYAEIGTIEIYVDLSEGDGMMGELTTVSGTLFSQDVEDGAFFVDPADEDVDNLFYIYDDVRTSNDDYARYEIYLRPWGISWDDMDSSLWPFYYSDWYIGSSAKDEPSMLTALLDTANDGVALFIHPGLPERAFSDGGSVSVSSTGGSEEPSEVETQAPTESAAIPAGGDGKTSLTYEEHTEIQSSFTQGVPRDDQYNYTYDMIRDQFFGGIEGESQPNTGVPDRLIYNWYATDYGHTSIWFVKDTGLFYSWSNVK